MCKSVLGLIVLICAASWFLSAGSPDASADQPDKNPKPRFPLGKETTYVNGPLDKAGYIDYVAALNEHLGKGVTADNNASVLLWKAAGPLFEGAPVPAEYFALLGMAAPPQKGDYFLLLHLYLKEHFKIDPDADGGKTWDQLDQARQRPWTAKQYPHFAAWLQANEKPLALIVEATKRSQYFSPLLRASSKDGPAMLLATVLYGVQQRREFANALALRSMLRVADGKYDAAWQDLLACHRLGRLVGRGTFLIDGLVGVAIDTIASDADLAFLDSARPDAKTLKSCLADLERLPPMPSMADKVEVAERFMFLDAVVMLDRDGAVQLEKLIGMKGKQVAEINWEPALRIGNRWFDRLTAAMRVKDRAKREQQLDEIEKDLKGLKWRISDPEPVGKALLDKKTTPTMRGEIFGELLTGLMVPAVRKVQNAEDRVEQLRGNRQVAIALARYQRDKGAYPKKLEELAPAYLAEIPPDLFTGKTLKYLPSDNGYLLYSFGVNGRDDQGRTYDDDPPGDDLRVRMPLPKLPEK
jgi:hypothetical protein